MERLMMKIERITLEQPEVQSGFMAMNFEGRGQINTGILFLKMSKPHEREATQNEVVQRLRREFAEVEGIQAFVTEFSFYAVSSEGGEKALAYSLRGPDLAELERVGNSGHRPAVGRARLCRSRPQPRSRTTAALRHGRSRTGARSRTRCRDHLRDRLLARRRTRSGLLHHPGQTLRRPDQDPTRPDPLARRHRRPPGSHPDR